MIALLPDPEREMPHTVSDEEVAGHRFGCACAPCRARPVELLRKVKRRARSAAPPRR